MSPNPSQVLKWLEGLPWQEGVPYALAALSGIESAATNPLEKAVIAQLITYLQSVKVQTPAPGA